MKKLFGIIGLVSVLGLGVGVAAATAFYPEEGEYLGEISRLLDEPQAMCEMNLLIGNVRITYQDANTVTMYKYIALDGYEIPVEEKLCKLAGHAMHCPQAEEQVLDFSFMGLDAVLTSPDPSGISVWDSATSYRQITAATRNTCEGADCAIVAGMLMSPGHSFPCNVPPIELIYTKAE